MKTIGWVSVDDDEDEWLELLERGRLTGEQLGKVQHTQDGTLAIEELLTILAHDPMPVKPLMALGFYGNAEVVPAILPLLNHWSIPVRVTAVQTVGKLGGLHYRTDMEDLLSDPSLAVRKTAQKELDRLVRDQAVRSSRDVADPNAS